MVEEYSIRIEESMKQSNRIVIAVIGIVFILMLGRIPLKGESTRGRYGVGFQRITWNCWGISVMGDWNKYLSFEALIGVVGDRQAYAGRILYRPFWWNGLNLYGYGEIGAETVGEYLIEETGLLLGTGIGAEWETGKIVAGLISFSINAEMGFENLSGYRVINANYFTFTYAAGFHIRI